MSKAQELLDLIDETTGMVPSGSQDKARKKEAEEVLKYLPKFPYSADKIVNLLSGKDSSGDRNILQFYLRIKELVFNTSKFKGTIEAWDKQLKKFDDPKIEKRGTQHYLVSKKDGSEIRIFPKELKPFVSFRVEGKI